MINQLTYNIIISVVSGNVFSQSPNHNHGQYTWEKYTQTYMYSYTLHRPLTINISFLFFNQRVKPQ